MGRQIATAMDDQDEAAFLAFLREGAVISIYCSWSPTRGAASSFEMEQGAPPFFIHNHAFPWTPTFEEVHYKDRVTGAPGIYFRPITRHAPVLEYSRHPITASNPAVAGRLYWSKFFVSQPDQVTYEISAFEAWYSHVARWVRKHGTQIPHGDTTPWCLPGARRALAP